MPESFNEKQWAMFCHLGALSGFFVPFGNIIVPLVIWSMKKQESPLIDKAGKESLNFQISMTLYMIVSAILILLIVGIFILIALIILDLVLIIVATIKADQGEDYEYPLTIRFVQ